MQANQNELELHRLYEVGSRRILILGCDREMILIAGVLCFVLAFAGMNLSYLICSICLWAFSLSLLRMMAKADPLMRFKVIRHIHYARQRVFRAKSSPFAGSRMYHS